VRLRRPLLLGSALALLGAAPATAAEVQVQGLGTSWSNAAVRIAAGDTVTWSFPNPDETHNVQAASPSSGTTSWTYSTVPQRPAVTGSFRFDATGIYEFVCAVHADTMRGTVTVGDPPPPPPPPLSEQPFPNDGGITASGLETGGLDTTRPALRGVRAKRSGTRVTVSFGVSERSLVTVRLRRGGRTVRTAKAAASRRGSVTVRGLKAGRYAVKVTATDVAGNVSRSRSAAFRIR
jgi:plastocyanin